MGQKYDIYVGRPMYEAIEKLATKKKEKVSAALQGVLTSVGIGSEEFKPVVLQVPKEILGLPPEEGREQLEEWLELKMGGILNFYFPSK